MLRNYLASQHLLSEQRAPEISTAAFQLNPDMGGLKLRRGFVNLACQRGVCYWVSLYQSTPSAIELSFLSSSLNTNYSFITI